MIYGLQVVYKPTIGPVHKLKFETILGMNWLESKTISVIEPRLLIKFSLAPHWDMSVAHISHISPRAYHETQKSL